VGLPGLVALRFRGQLFDRYRDDKVALDTAGGLVVIVLVFELLAKRPVPRAKAKA
jgi:hypothetical protein